MCKLLLEAKKLLSCVLMVCVLAMVAGVATAGDTGGASGTNSAPAAGDGQKPEDITLRVGDLVIITFQNAPDLNLHEERIKEDGSITLKHIGSMKAAGKTRGELQKDIQTAYVPKYYPNLVATIKAEDRYFFVAGDVKMPNRYVYAGQTTVLNCIATANGFTEYARKTKVVVTRVDGKQYTVDCEKAEKNPKLDLPIYPGDRIFVPRRPI